jgi:hypothetical protein
MYTFDMSVIELKLPLNVASIVFKGGEPLRVLCREEVDIFEAYLRTQEGYTDGLANFERLAIEGYLYQKIRGRLNAKDGPGDLPVRREDGKKGSD